MIRKVVGLVRTLTGFRSIVIAVALVLSCLVVASEASAAESALWQKCPKGSAAGQCRIPRGVATSPIDGHVFVADQNNSRIVELTAWGAFVKAWGWGVDDGSSQLQVCSAETGCQAGLTGGGAGEFSAPQGIATDSTGAVYVVDHDNLRVQKFSAAGDFLLMFGGGVNETSGGNLCPRPGFPADICKAGTSGTANGQFSGWPFSSFIAVGPGDQIYVGDKERIQIFNTAGEYTGQIAQPGKTVYALAVDNSGGVNNGDLYVSYASGEALAPAAANVTRMSSSGETQGTLEVRRPTALAVDGEGHVYVADQFYFSGNSSDPENHEFRILEFDSAGKQVDLFAEGDIARPDGGLSTGLATGSACFSEGEGIYFSASNENGFVAGYGPAPDLFTGKGEKCEPPEVAPSITQQYALSVGANDATLGAKINPHFWADTTYYVEYGTGKCSEGGCTSTQPTPPGSLLGAGVVDAEVPSAGVFIAGLLPGTVYHYRFVAQSSGGGPTIGAEGTFTTFKSPSLQSCPGNEAFRTGASTALPDCRVYEMVSPVDKEGGDIEVLGKTTRLNQSAFSGDAMTYSAYRAFGNAKSAPFASQYLAKRVSGSGWASTPISPPQEGENVLPTEYSQLDSLFKAFSPELDTAWNATFNEPVLGPGGQAGFPNIYRRDNAGGSYQACSAVKPLQVEFAGPEFQAAAGDQNHAVFRTRNKLTAEAATGTTNAQIYGCSFQGDEVATVRFVSALPNGEPSLLENSLGTVSADFVGNSMRAIWLKDAISADGSRIFWTASTGSSGPGTLYVRVNAGEEESKHNLSGKCTQSFKACTYPVSGSASSEPARYWGANPDGTKALFAVEGKSTDLYLFDVDKQIKGEEPKTLIAKESLGVLGASTDLSRVYFLSKEAIGGGVAGKPNLYLYETGQPTTFIATLVDVDAVPIDIFSPVNQRPDRHLARVSADGSHLVFVSSAGELAKATAGYDNRDLATDASDAEVYRYAAATKALACISCNPSGARPNGGRQIGSTDNGKITAAAIARITPWTTTTYPSRALSEDGKRVFFESYEPLVLGDTNGRADVYQWEEAANGDCTAATPTYNPASGGCVELISSGKSSADAEFIDASPEGDDVFFTTASSLLIQDPGSIDLYDARAGGGFPPPPPPNPGCEGQACQNPPAPPNDPTPGTSSFHGPGNVVEPKPPKHCPKGKHKVKKNGKTTCVKNKKKTKKSGSKGKSGRAGK